MKTVKTCSTLSQSYYDNDSDRLSSVSQVPKQHLDGIEHIKQVAEEYNQEKERPFEDNRSEIAPKRHHKNFNNELDDFERVSHQIYSAFQTVKIFMFGEQSFLFLNPLRYIVKALSEIKR